ncbi:alginate export family protein [Photobacterium sagamiensis]|uniref:alginate export family protein n=1 Tax=Photobacterium sagamiensis TaxID=2910241 RepID=UPI003D11FC0C
MNLRSRFIYIAPFLCFFWLSQLQAQTTNNDSGDIDSSSNVKSSDSIENTSRNVQFPSHIPRARWSEDWSRLRTEEPDYSDEWLPFKHIELADDSDNFISFGGEYRFTYERYDPEGRGMSDIGEQDVFLHRFAVHADWHPADKLRLFLQLGAAAASDREGGNKAGDKSHLNIWQLFVDGRLPLNNDERLDIRVGRQFIEKYNWLVGAGEARNVRQYYDGVRVAWLDRGFAKFDFYAAEFVDAAEESFEMAGTDEYFWGANSEMRFDDYNFNLLYFGWNLKGLQFEQDGGNRHDETRHTLTARLYRPVTLQRQWLFDSYLIYQFGEYEDSKNSNISAYAVFGEVKYAFYPQEETPIIGIKASYFSGDDDPNDNKLNTFYDPIFVTPYFTYARDVMPYNLMHLQPNVGYRFNSELQMTLSNDFLWRAEKNDAFYTGASAIGVNASQSDHRYIGSQLQLSLNWVATRQIVISSHLAHFNAADVVEDGGGENQLYTHLGLSYMF